MCVCVCVSTLLMLSVEVSTLLMLSVEVSGIAEKGPFFGLKPNRSSFYFFLSFLFGY